MNHFENQPRRRSHSFIELRDHSLLQMQWQVQQLKEKLVIVTEENKGLKKYVEEINQECMELHAQLFEESNKRVQAAMANENKAVIANQDLRLQLELVRGELSAMKSIVSQYESRPRPQMARILSHSTDDAPTHRPPSSIKTSLTQSLTNHIKGHRRSCSYHENTSTTVANKTGVSEPSDLESVDALSFQAFVDWLDTDRTLFSPADLLPPCTAASSLSTSPNDNNTTSTLPTFLVTIVTQDVLPCLTFSSLPDAITVRILQALPDIHLSIHPLGQAIAAGSPCPLVRQQSCQYLLKFHDNATASVDWLEVGISQFARNRIVSVCNFYQYLGFIRRGLVVKATQMEQFCNVQKLRRSMHSARLGFHAD